jgi:type IV secretory pathway TrbD component
MLIATLILGILLGWLSVGLGVALAIVAPWLRRWRQEATELSLVDAFHRHFAAYCARPSRRA